MSRREPACEQCALQATIFRSCVCAFCRDPLAGANAIDGGCTRPWVYSIWVNGFLAYMSALTIYVQSTYTSISFFGCYNLAIGTYIISLNDLFNLYNLLIQVL